MITSRTRFLYLVLFIPMTLGLGCTLYDFVTPRPISFGALQGINIGDPVELDNGSKEIPVDFDMVLKAQSIPTSFHKIESVVADGTIHFWVTMSHPKHTEERPKTIIVRPPKSGTYEVFYRDPDGTLHTVGTVFLKASASRAVSSSF